MYGFTLKALSKAVVMCYICIRYGAQFYLDKFDESKRSLNGSWYTPSEHCGQSIMHSGKSLSCLVLLNKVPNRLTIVSKIQLLYCLPTLTVLSFISLCCGILVDRCCPFISRRGSDKRSQMAANSTGLIPGIKPSLSLDPLTLSLFPS